MVAREYTQVVPWLVLQLLIPIGVETHEDGRSAAGNKQGSWDKDQRSISPLPLDCLSRLQSSPSMLPALVC